MQYYSDITKKLYSTIEALETAEAALLKAEKEKKSAQTVALAELDELVELFDEKQKENQETFQAMKEISKTLNKKYSEFFRKYGYLPEKHSAHYFLIRML